MKAFFKELKCDRKNQAYVGGECVTGTVSFDGGNKGCSLYDLKLELLTMDFKSASSGGNSSTSQLDVNLKFLKECVHVFRKPEDGPVQIAPHKYKQLQFSIKVHPALESSFVSLKMPAVCNVYILRLTGSVQPKLGRGYLLSSEIILHQKPITIIKKYGCTCPCYPVGSVERETFWRCAKIKVVMNQDYALPGEAVFFKMVYVDEPNTKDHPEVAEVQVHLDVWKFLPPKFGKEDKRFAEESFKQAKAQWCKLPIDLEKEPKTFFKGKFRIPFVIPPMRGERPKSAAITLKHRIVICLKVGNNSTSFYKLSFPITIATRTSEDVEQRNKIAVSYFNMMCSKNLEHHEYDIDFDKISLLSMDSLQASRPPSYKSNWSVDTMIDRDEEDPPSYNSNMRKSCSSAPPYYGLTEK